MRAAAALSPPATHLCVVALVSGLAHQLQRPRVPLGHRHSRLPQRPRPAAACACAGTAEQQAKQARHGPRNRPHTCSGAHARRSGNTGMQQPSRHHSTLRQCSVLQAHKLRRPPHTHSPRFCGINSMQLTSCSTVQGRVATTHPPRFCGTFFSSAVCQVLPPSADTSTLMMPCPPPLQA